MIVLAVLLQVSLLLYLMHVGNYHFRPLVVILTVSLSGYPEHRDRLVAMGVNFEVKKVTVGFDVIYSALEAYKAVNGNLLVPQKFVVPQGDVRFPVESWEMKVGSECE